VVKGKEREVIAFGIVLSILVGEHVVSIGCEFLRIRGACAHPADAFACLPCGHNRRSMRREDYCASGGI